MLQYGINVIHDVINYLHETMATYNKGLIIEMISSPGTSVKYYRTSCHQSFTIIGACRYSHTLYVISFSTYRSSKRLA